MENKEIIIKGARENNLKNINLTLPKNALIAFSGLSGSGKSTLAFDTIYSEGRRRYVESLSSYARQFLGNLEKPDVESIVGLSPAIAIEQKTTSNNPRSTVATVTEIYDYLRLLFARIGIPFCPTHNTPIKAFSVLDMQQVVKSYPRGSKLQLLSPIKKNELGSFKDLINKYIVDGFVRFRIDGVFYTNDDLPILDKNKRHSLDIVVDRIVIKDDLDTRLNEAISLATSLSDGYLIIYDGTEDKLLSKHHSCPLCGFSVPKLEPRLFSFNAPLGYCPACKGLGIKKVMDITSVAKDQNKSILEGAIRYFSNPDPSRLDFQAFLTLLKHYNIDPSVPFKNYNQDELDIILNGSKEKISYTVTSSKGNILKRKSVIEGIKTRIERLYYETTSTFNREYYDSYFKDEPCDVCHGARLSVEALSVKVNKLNIYEVTKLSVEKLHTYLNETWELLSEYDKNVSRLVIKELLNRSRFLIDVGLNYLTLDRTASTLSGGESQRIRLATQIGSKLSGILYVLDEPSIGLHQKDNDKLIATLKEMRDLGNTVIVVEHDEDTIRNADFICDIGVGAGVHGGEVVVSGTLNDVMNCEKSLTGQYLSGKRKIEVPKIRRKGNGKKLIISECNENNLKDITVSFPLGKFICVTGVSGSGKSTLVNKTLYEGLKRDLLKQDADPGKYESIKGMENIDKIIHINQEPIGRTPRSNPATYTKVFDDIRDLFASTVLAKAKGFNKGRFSFNVDGGRCESCLGAGVKKISMNFLPDVYVTCDVCNGRRYNEETLSVTYKGKNIYDVLEMTIEDAYTFFESRNEIRRKLQTLLDVGLGYIKLGQNATTLSGGEAQRVKLAYELQRIDTGSTLYILDEPTTGLHVHDVKKLIAILNRIVDKGNSVIVIEHNLDVIKVSDYIIDLGPDGGDNGGEIIACGTPEEVSNNKRSYTGQYLKKIL